MIIKKRLFVPRPIELRDCQWILRNLLYFIRVQSITALTCARFEAVVSDLVHQVLHELLLHLCSNTLQVLLLLLGGWLCSHSQYKMLPCRSNKSTISCQFYEVKIRLLQISYNCSNSVIMNQKTFSKINYSVLKCLKISKS